MTRRCIVALVWWTIGCSAPGRPVSGGMAVIGVANVNGTQIDTYIGDAGPVPVPVDLSATAITATFRDAEGSFVTVTGSGGADGSFTVAGVPAGSYALRLGNGPYIVTDARVLDLGSSRMGRPAPRLATQFTPVYLNLTHLSPWTEEDLFEAMAANVGAYAIGMTLFTTPGDEETVSPPGMGFDHQSDMRPPALIDESQGDRLILNQFTRQRTERGYSYVTPVRGFIAPPFTQADGQPTTISGALDEVEPATVRLRWQRTVPDSFRELVRPGSADNASVFVLSKSRVNLSLTPSPILISSRLEVGPSSGTDLDQTFDYGVPALPDWPTLIVQLQFSYFVPLQLPDTQPFLQPSVNVATVPLETISAGPFGALIGPVGALTVNGACARSDLGEVTLPVTLAWDPPTVGEASWYTVTVYRLISAGGLTIPVTQGTLVTGSTTLTLPPGLLTEGGGTYVISITGLSGSGRDPAHPLAALSFPWGRADAFSGFLTTR